MIRIPLVLALLMAALIQTISAQITPAPLPTRAANLQNTAGRNLIPGTMLGQSSLTDSPAGLPFSDAMIPRDNIAGTFVLQEVGHIRPIAATGNVLYTVNQEAGYLVAFGTNPLQKILEVPLGLGANSVYEHPNRQFEIWITDSLSNCVSVFDPATLTLGHTIRTSGSPHALAFSASGDRAYVTCSSGRTVDVIDTNSFAVINSIAIPARRPRGIARVGDNIHIAPLFSGNNTTALAANGSNTSFVLELPPLAILGVNPLADIDIRTIGVSPTGTSFEMLNSALEFTEVGTTIFNVQNRPGTTELWISNTDALNAAVIAEPNFVDGQVVRNRISIVDVAAGPGGAITHVDLDQVSGVGCAQPRGVAFDPVRQRVYVMCEGSDRVAVLSESGGWLGFYKLQGQGAIRCLPQGATVVVDKLYVFNKGTNSITQIDLLTTPLDSTVANHMSLGPTPLTEDVRRGRSIINNADLSASGASSCASCHIDGDLDGVIWDLSGVLDPQGTPNNQLTFWTDRKGPMVTQSLNGLPEGAPYHWRGERKDVEAFNVAFEGLLDGSQLGSAELGDMVSYINELHYPANHAQQDDRVTTPNELEGARIFLQELATGSATCADCHTMPLGTNNEPMREFVGGFAPSIEVAQLRGVADKELGKHDLGNFAGIPLGDGSDIGPALVHDGRFATLFDFSNDFVNIDPTEAAMLEEFMNAFDTGLAPATAIQATMTQANALTMPELNLLINEATEGECDLVTSGSVTVGGGATTRVTGFFDSTTGLFEFEAKAFGNVPPSFIVLFVNAGYGSWTFRGVPVGTGRRLIDKDLDGIGNIDENMYSTDPENPDSDGDGFPDGYEIIWGMDPNVVDTSSPDGQAPGIVSSTPIFATTNTVKIEVETDELCVVVATWTGLRGAETRVSSKFAPYAKRHQFVINFLPENAPTTVTLTATDPNSLSSSMTMVVTTNPERVADIHINDMTLTTGIIAISTGGTQATTILNAKVEVFDHLGQPALAGYQATAFVYFEPAPGQLQVVSTATTAVTDSSGKATFLIPLNWSAPFGGAGTRKVYFGVIDIVPTNGSGLLNAYTEANDVVNFKTLNF